VKTCSGCGETKLLDQFSINRRAKDGRQSRCKACARAYRRAHREDIRSYNLANRQRIAELRQTYQRANRKRIAKQKQVYYQANRQRIAERNRAYYQANRERLMERNRAYYTANREQHNKRQRAYYYANRTAFVNYENRRRARRGCAVSQRWVVDHSLGDPLACWWCGRGLLGTKPHLDHVMPISLGGPAGPSNEVLTCETCNTRKRAKHPLVWLAEIAS